MKNRKKAPPRTIRYNKVDYADRASINTTVHISFWGRIKLLFAPRIIIGHDLYSQTLFKDHVVEAHFGPVFYWSDPLFRLKMWWRKLRGKPTGEGEMSPTSDKQPQMKVVRDENSKQ